jgi:hypothetical protein
MRNYAKILLDKPEPRKDLGICRKYLHRQKSQIIRFFFLKKVPIIKLIVCLAVIMSRVIRKAAGPVTKEKQVKLTTAAAAPKISMPEAAGFQSGLPEQSMYA